MNEDTQTLAPATETLNVDRATLVALHSGSAASPNLPFGDWTFCVTEDGELDVTEATSKSNKTYSYYEVMPTGSTNDATRRRIYPNALTTASAEKILFTAEGKLKKSAKFGVFATTENGQRVTTVSAKQKDVENGIALAGKQYADERAAKAEAATV